MTKVVVGALEHTTIGTHYDMGVIAICSIWISIWLVVTCMKDYIVKLLLVKPIILVLEILWKIRRLFLSYFVQYPDKINRVLQTFLSTTTNPG